MVAAVFTPCFIPAFVVCCAGSEFVALTLEPDVALTEGYVGRYVDAIVVEVLVAAEELGSGRAV